MLSAYDHLFSSGSYNSEETSSVPPVISTCPLLSNMAVWPSPLGLSVLPADDQELLVGWNISVEGTDP